MADTLKKRKLPPIESYQTRCVEGGLSALRRDKDVLIEAPTGAGKTPIIARLASRYAQLDKKVLVLTHRKMLFNQMVGRPDADTEKKRLGEINYWGGAEPGTIADTSLGGVNQSKPVVVGMVESVASRLDDLEDYDAIIIDETQHVSEASTKGEISGAYSKVIEALSNAKIVGTTATTFRGDRDKLHPRLEAGHREIVAIDEARGAGRIVPAKTIIGRARTKSGYTAAELVQMENEGRLKKSDKFGNSTKASAVLEKDRGDDFYDHVVEDWSRLLDRSKTIVFVDYVENVKDMTKRFNARYGEGVAVCLHGGTEADGKKRTMKQNSEALREYDEGSAKVLIACEMIGEGFDVPDTDAVMSVNSSLSRLQMNQFAGRCVRASLNKEYGIFVDYGTASHYHGLIEHQHEMQNIEALSAAKTKVSAARVLGRMAPVSKNGWYIAPGGDSTLFMKRNGKRFTMYKLDHKARKTSKYSGNGKTFNKLVHPEFGTKALEIQDVARVLSAHAKEEAEYYARMGGVTSQEYENISKTMFKSWQPEMERIDHYNSQASEGSRARSEALRISMSNDPQSAVKGRMLRKALEEPKSGKDTVKACLDLSGDILSKCANSQGLPLGLTAEAREVVENLASEDLREMKPMEMRQEALATSSVLRHIKNSVKDENLSKAIENVSEPLSKGIKRLTREIALAKRNKKMQRA